MNNGFKKKFNWRAFISIYVSFSFIIMVFSGIILFLAPAGRIAKWTHIFIFGMEKESWQAVHTIFTFLFILAGVIHIYYNWKPLMNYLKSKAKDKITIRKELILSFLFTLTIFALTLFNIPPFSTIMDLGESLTDSWATEETEPPVPHAETMTFDELATSIEKPVDNMLNNLKEQNITATKDDIIKDVADRYKLTPMDLFGKMKTVKKVGSLSPHAGSGLGMKTLSEVCKTIDVDLNTSLSLLAKNGLDVSANMTLKDIAGKYDKNPIDVIEMIDIKNQ
jgi:hypothetical protein